MSGPAPAGWSHPIFRDKPTEHPYVVRLLLDAATEEEWRDGLAWLVSDVWYLASRDDEGLALDERRRRQALPYLGWLEALIRRGFQPKPHRPKSVLARRGDIALILGTGALPGACNSIAEATARLVLFHRITPEAARKRVLAAEREGGFRLPRRRPFGRKG